MLPNHHAVHDSIYIPIWTIKDASQPVLDWSPASIYIPIWTIKDLL